MNRLQGMNKISCTIIVLGILVSNAFASNTTWTGIGTDSSWMTASNWSAGIPSSTDSVTFDGAGGISSQKPCKLNVDTTITSLRVYAGYTGIIDLSNNTLSIKQDVNFNGGGILNTGTLEFIGTNGSMQLLSCSIGDTLPKIVHSGYGTLRLVNSIKTMQYDQTHGTLDMFSKSLTVLGTLSISKTDSFGQGIIGLSYDTLRVLGNATLSGTDSTMIPLIGINLLRFENGGTINVSWAVIKNSGVANSTGIATNSYDSTGNTNWSITRPAKLWRASTASYKNPSNWLPAGVPTAQDSIIFDSGSNLKCNMDTSVQVKDIIFKSGYSGSFDFASNQLTVRRNADFRSSGLFTKNSGASLFFYSPTSCKRSFFPKPSFTFPKITAHSSGGPGDTLLIMGNLYADGLNQTYGTIDWGNGFNHAVGILKADMSGEMNFRTSTVTVTGDTAFFSTMTNVTFAAGAKLKIASDSANAIQWLAGTWNTLPPVEHLGPGLLKIYYDSLKCASFTQDSGKLDLSMGSIITTTGNFSLTNGSKYSLQGLGFKKIASAGNILIEARPSDTLELTPANTFTLSVGGAQTITIRNAKVGKTTFLSSTTAQLQNCYDMSGNTGLYAFLNAKKWLGTSGTAWSTPANWAPAGIPIASDSVVFKASSNNCVLDTTSWLASIVFDSTYQGSFDFSTNSMTIYGSTSSMLSADFRSGGDIIPGSGVLILNPLTTPVKMNFWPPRIMDTLPPIQKTGMGVVQLAGGDVYTPSFKINSSGALDSMHFGYGSSHITVDSFVVSSGNVHCGNSMLKVKGPLVDFSGATSVVPYNATIDFMGTGTTILRSKAGLAIPNVYHTGSGIISLAGAPLRIAGSFSQTNGTLDLEGFNIDSIAGNFSLSPNTDITNIDGKKIRVFGNASLNGTSGNLIQVKAHAAPCTLAVSGTLNASYAVLKNITATQSLGVADVMSADSGGNIGWTFTDNTPPTLAPPLFTFPAGGEVFTNSTITITWLPGKVTDNRLLRQLPITLRYSLNGGINFDSSIATGIANSGSAIWNIPNSVNSKRVRLQMIASDSAGNASSLTSPGDFIIDNMPTVVTSQTLTVPNGGEVWSASANRQISWNTIQVSDSLLKVNPVSLDYSINNGATFTSIVPMLANTGSFMWNIPYIHASACKVRIGFTDSTGHTSYDTSNASFAIDSTKPQPQSFVILDSNGYSNRVPLSFTVSATNADSMTFGTDTIAFGPWRPYTTRDSLGVAMGDGTKYLVVRFKNKAGIVSGWLQDSTKLDVTRPLVSISFSGYHNAASYPGSIAGSASDVGTSVDTVLVAIKSMLSNTYWDGAAFQSQTPMMFRALGTTQWSYPFAVANLSNATYAIEALSIDVAGNKSMIAHQSFTFASTRPKLLNGLTARALGCSSAVITWSFISSGSTDSVLLRASVAGPVTILQGGEFAHMVPLSNIQDTLKGLPHYGALLYVTAFSKDSYGNYSVYDPAATATCQLMNCVTPTNPITINLASIGDTALSMAISNTASIKPGMHLEYGYNFSITPTETHMQQWLPLKDTTVIIPKTTSPGIWYVGVKVADSLGRFSSPVFQSISLKNILPVFTKRMYDTTLAQDQYWADTMKATDVNGDPLMFASKSVPVGCIITRNGVLTWKPLRSNVGTVTIIAVCTDSHGGATYDTAKIVVKRVDYPPKTAIVSKNVMYGAARYFVTGTPDNGGTCSFRTVLVALGTGVTLDSSIRTRDSVVYYPLTNGKYLFAVAAIDNSNRIDPNPKLDTFTVANSTMHAFTDTIGWHMIGIPSSPQNADTIKSGGYLSTWNESNPERNVYGYYTPSNEVQMVNPGRGYWRKSSNPLVISIDPSRRIDSNVVLSLSKNKYGWNQIASPYTYATVWNGGPTTLWRWDGVAQDFVDAGSILEPWQGYWVLTDVAKTVALSKIPAFPATGMAKASKSFFAAKTDWQVQAILSDNGSQDADNIFGFSHDATPGYNHLNRPEPPRMESSSYLFFPHPEWKRTVSEYASDIRRFWQDGSIFSVGISRSSKNVACAKITFSGVPEDGPLYFFYATTDSIIPLTAATAVQPIVRSGVSYATVFVSENKNFVATFPRRFAMGTPFPNPCSYKATIKYVLPYRFGPDGSLDQSSYQVSIKVFDMMGRTVRELVNHPQGAGIYTTFWDGKSSSLHRVSAGNYICIMTAGKYRSVGRITLMR